MKYSWFTLLLLLAMTGTAPAQLPVITSETPVNSNLLQQWFHSGDPRLIAWAADFARRTHDTQIMTEMSSWLEHCPIPPPTYGNEPQSAQQRAVITVLDALIQENVQVPIPAIEAVAPSFPSQAIILIGRLPLAESRSTLNDWTYGDTGDWGGRILARVASMMLAKDPESIKAHESSFVPRFVAASEEDLKVSVKSDSNLNPYTFSGTCGDALGRKNPPGWPQIFTYFLDENNPQAMNAPAVIDLHGDRIVYMCIQEDGGWGSCGGLQLLNPVTRHRLIAYWLGIRPKEMTWQPEKHATIVWTNKAAYEQQLGALVEVEREKLQATVNALYQRGILTENQTVTAAPKLIVTIKCDIQPCPLMQ